VGALRRRQHTCIAASARSDRFTDSYDANNHVLASSHKLEFSRRQSVAGHIYEPRTTCNSTQQTRARCQQRAAPGAVPTCDRGVHVREPRAAGPVRGSLLGGVRPGGGVLRLGPLRLPPRLPCPVLNRQHTGPLSAAWSAAACLSGPVVET
jgi:hypothetical protein